MGHRERLQRHMALRGFRIKDVPGDNNCQFHALADQLEQVGVSGFTAGKLRKLTVSWLQENGDRPMDNGKVGERQDRSRRQTSCRYRQTQKSPAL